MAFDRYRRRKCTSVGRVTAQVLLSFLTLAPPSAAAWSPEAQIPFLQQHPLFGSTKAGISDQNSEDTFTLRHVVHRGTTRYPSLHRRLDVSPNRIRTALTGFADEEDGVGPYITKSSPVHIPRLQERSVGDLAPMLYAAQTYGETVTFPDDAWTLDEVPSPNITDWDTVINLALMTGSAYNKDKSDPEWEDVRPPFNLSRDVGWEQDGLRGHVFANKDNSTIVLAIKGTTSAVFDGAETTTNDKENDNLFASCCCGQGEHNYLWKKVCDCMTSAFTCNDTCVIKHMNAPSRYYKAGIELYGNVTELYPNATVWMTGHSLGGLVTGLLGLTFGLPVVTFEAVPQALAASRLGLPVPPGYKSVLESRASVALWNFGHTADPVYQGACNSASSLCTIAGYALQSQCHAGMRCEYDTVKEWKWRMSLTTHGIRGCIKDVYRAWEGGVPKCETDPECRDCFNWKRYTSNGSDITTTHTSTTSSTRTRTETCKTPGWWGCLDSSTTSPVSSTTSTTTFTTETCLSRGWFGNCLDEITTTVTSRTTMPIPTTTSSTAKETGTETDCETPGWFGCKDPTTTTTSSPKYRTVTTTARTTTTEDECETPGFFWGCKDKSTSITSTAPEHTITEAPEHDMIL